MLGEATATGTRLRARYSKTGKVRFTSHRDVVRMWERALRRSGLPVAWSEGYSPRPLLSFGHALPTGAESFAEYLDIRLAPGLATVPGTRTPAQDLRVELAQRLTALLPEGVDVHAIAPLPVGSGSLQQEVSSCSWKLEVHGLASEELTSRVERLLAAPTALIERERKGRITSDDLRPAVLALTVTACAEDGLTGGPTTHLGRAWLEAEVATRPRGVRPRELVEVLGPGTKLSRAWRLQQWIERDGTRREPLAICGQEVGTAATRAERRAS
ncbi:MAG: TIGR03936 family radical SAM-associated protein [Actinomycetota bacterium]|jgi:radical SAM-linked protein|nr:TIGR03936 family radical SAM-associated protein [Actinomycetota bacterium]